MTRRRNIVSNDRNGNIVQALLLKYQKIIYKKIVLLSNVDISNSTHHFEALPCFLPDGFSPPYLKKKKKKKNQ